MFISLVLNTEYGNSLSRKLFYLQNLRYCAENEGVLISYECMREHYAELRKGVSRQLLNDWNIEGSGDIDDNKVEQYFIPDTLFEKLKGCNQFRTKTIYGMFEDNCPELEQSLQEIIDRIKKNHPNESIEGLFCVQEPLQFVRDVCQKNNIPLIPFFFSAIRRPHGYRETLYYVNLKDWLYSTDEPQCRYQKFLEENNDFPILLNRDLIAFFGKPRTFPLLPYMNIEPKYELGVCCEAWSVIPQYFSRDKVTDDDIFYDADRLYAKNQIKVRSHSLQLDEIQVDRSFVHNDPASYILSCRRLAAVRSQILLKSLLWGRTTVAYTNMLGFSFLCSKDIDSVAKVDLRALNWYLFGYLIPHDLMFSHDYWRWRLKCPSESEIYSYHLNHLLKKHSISYDMLLQSDDQRFRSLLDNRIKDSELVNVLSKPYMYYSNDVIDFDNAISKFEINGKSYWRINKVDGSMLKCHIEIMNTNFSEFYFYPFDDVAGLGIIHSISINGLEVYKNTEPIFFEKTKGRVDLLPIIKKLQHNQKDIVLDVKWESKELFSFIRDVYPTKVIE